MSRQNKGWLVRCDTHRIHAPLAVVALIVVLTALVIVFTYDPSILLVQIFVGLTLLVIVEAVAQSVAHRRSD